jgi:CheY-like chemotaxis protein
MFSQGDTAAEGDGAQTGLGVGLALAKRLVELHDGTIEAHSAGRGLGSTFTVTLPVAAHGTAPVTTVPRARGANVQPHRILLVDDNVDFAASLALLLEGLGHKVAIAHDAATAIEIAREFRPDFGFLDLGLPDVSGYTLARRLHSHPETANTILIAVSGWGQPEDRRRSKDAGFAMHLVKPVDLEDIESAMQMTASA